MVVEDDTGLLHLFSHPPFSWCCRVYSSFTLLSGALTLTDQTARKFSAGFKKEEVRVCESRLAACRIQHLACSLHQF